MKTLLSTLALSLVASLSTGCAVAPVDAGGVPEDPESTLADPPEDPEIGLLGADAVIDGLIPLERCEMVHIICRVQPDGDMLCEVPDADCDVETADATFNGLEAIEALPVVPINACGMVHLFCSIEAGGAIQCDAVSPDCGIAPSKEGEE